MSKEIDWDFRNLFVAAVKAAGGKLVINVEDYVRPPTVSFEGIDDNNNIYFVTVEGAENE